MSPTKASLQLSRGSGGSKAAETILDLQGKSTSALTILWSECVHRNASNASESISSWIAACASEWLAKEFVFAFEEALDCLFVRRQIP